jgi:hypothetical protein
MLFCDEGVKEQTEKWKQSNTRQQSRSPSAFPPRLLTLSTTAKQNAELFLFSFLRALLFLRQHIFRGFLGPEAIDDPLVVFFRNLENRIQGYGTNLGTLVIFSTVIAKRTYRIRAVEFVGNKLTKRLLVFDAHNSLSN